jgi:hypothetical protein
MHQVSTWSHDSLLYLRFISVHENQLYDIELFLHAHFEENTLRYKKSEIFLKTGAQMQDIDADNIEDPYVQYYYYLDQT